MNRLADLLIELNKHRLPDDYIQREVELFVQDLKADIVGETAMFEQAQEDAQAAPTFCICRSEEQRTLCPHNGKCISLGEE